MSINLASPLIVLQALAILFGQSGQIYDKAELGNYNISYLDDKNGAYLAISGDNYTYGYLMSMWTKDTGEATAFGAKILDCSDKILRCKDIGIVKVVDRRVSRTNQFMLGGFRFYRSASSDGVHYKAVCGEGPCPSTAAAGISIVQSYEYMLDKQGKLLSLSVNYTPGSDHIGRTVSLKKKSCDALRV